MSNYLIVMVFNYGLHVEWVDPNAEHRLWNNVNTGSFIAEFHLKKRDRNSGWLKQVHKMLVCWASQKWQQVVERASVEIQAWFSNNWQPDRWTGIKAMLLYHEKTGLRNKPKKNKKTREQHDSYKVRICKWPRNMIYHVGWSNDVISGWKFMLGIYPTGCMSNRVQAYKRKAKLTTLLLWNIYGSPSKYLHSSKPFLQPVNFSFQPCSCVQWGMNGKRNGCRGCSFCSGMEHWECPQPCVWGVHLCELAQ